MNKKKIFLTFLILISFCFSIEGVYAARSQDYKNKCRYNYTDHNGKNALLFVYPQNDKQTTDINDIEFEGDGKGAHTIGSGGEDDSRDTGLFVLDGEKGTTLYCPTKVYMCYDGETNKLAANKSDCKKNAATLTLSSNTGDTDSYDAKEDNGTLKSCDKGAKERADSIASLLEDRKSNFADPIYIMENAESIFNELDTLQEEINNSNYCMSSVVDKTSDLEMLNTELMTEVEKSELISEEMKNAYKQKAAKIAEKIAVGMGKMGEFGLPSSDTTYDCEGLLDEDLKLVLSTILDLIRIAAPILVIILTAVDFGQAVISNDQDAVKKAVSKVGKRLIAALALFFIPYIVGILLEMPGISDWVSDSPNCNL